jgi:hypothetical protein
MLSMAWSTVHLSRSPSIPCVCLFAHGVWHLSGGRLITGGEQACHYSTNLESNTGPTRGTNSKRGVQGEGHDYLTTYERYLPIHRQDVRRVLEIGLQKGVAPRGCYIVEDLQTSFSPEFGTPDGPTDIEYVLRCCEKVLGGSGSDRRPLRSHFERQGRECHHPQEGSHVHMPLTGAWRSPAIGP